MSNLLKIVAAIFACLALLPLTAFFSNAVAAGLDTEISTESGVSSRSALSSQDSDRQSAVQSMSVSSVTASSTGLAQVLSQLYPDIGLSESRPEYYKVLLSESGKVIELSAADYLRGVVAAEMPLEYEDEALKAQIIASHTYALNFKAKNMGKNNSDLKGADISDSPDQGQAYITDEEIAKRYPNDYEQQMERLDGLIEEVLHLILLYEGEPIVATYHAVSAGKTESAKNIWGAYSPYLVSVESKGDVNSPDYSSTRTFTEAEVKKILTEKGAKLSSTPSKWFSDLLRTDAGYVAAGQIGGITLDGITLRNMFNLRSTCFTVSYEKGIFTFSVKGWGHGAGMSQYGANYMAKNGSNYVDILKWYYQGVALGEL